MDYVPYSLRSEVGVLSYPLSKEVVKLWRFKTVYEAHKSAEELYSLGKKYLAEATADKKMHAFLKADLVRKFLQMGYTRARRYYNHSSGHKYAKDGTVLPFDRTDMVKLESSNIFWNHWQRFIDLKRYCDLKHEWSRLPRQKKIDITREALF